MSNPTPGAGATDTELTVAVGIRRSTRLPGPDGTQRGQRIHHIMPRRSRHCGVQQYIRGPKVHFRYDQPETYELYCTLQGTQGLQTGVAQPSSCAPVRVKRTSRSPSHASRYKPGRTCRPAH
ncbi:uncharacterized protein PpBr36_10116 [Pyricularia pennisetigena]|uniref:uncharacterized protein n=1 Tax=Pyricularia pennisetigena TaxID=1578925 RepID=UPI00114E0F18|nr:uncharacterized protein PpBr36_10116 [Pyricularia pennisetigena]TLS21607.1 hypothetical protein PpBr36_10116 [Pyricularia pennisetigena]